MNVTRDHNNAEAQLAEYSAIRAEIQQLNGQIFSVLSGSLALDVSILGLLFGEHASPRDPYLLPTVGILFLSAGNYILLNRNRLAHRLGLFQKYFVESRQPAICWARVSLKYRDQYSEGAGLFASFAERLADSGSYVLLGASVLNILILIVLGLSPYFTASHVAVDWAQIANLIVASAFTTLEWLLLRVMTNYEKVNRAMKKLATDAGLTPP